MTWYRGEKQNGVRGQRCHWVNEFGELFCWEKVKNLTVEDNQLPSPTRICLNCRAVISDMNSAKVVTDEEWRLKCLTN